MTVQFEQDHEKIMMNAMETTRCPTYSLAGLIVASVVCLLPVVPQAVNGSEGGEPSTASSAVVPPAYGLHLLSFQANQEDRDIADQFDGSAGHQLFLTANDTLLTVSTAQVPAEHEAGSTAWDQLPPTTSSTIQVEGDNTTEMDGREDFVLALSYDSAMR